MERSELIAKDLLKIKAVFFRPDEPFTWASGIKSPVYCDNRLTLTAPEVRSDVENSLAAVIRDKYPQVEVLMGTSTAGIAHAAIVGHIMAYGTNTGMNSTCAAAATSRNYRPFAFPSSQISSISARVMSVNIRPLRIVCSSR